MKKMRKLNALLLMTAFLFLTFPAVDLFSESPIIKLYNEGLKKEQSGEFYSALFTYKRVLQENPYFVDAIIGLGRVYYNLKDYPKSIKYLKKALDLDKNNVDALINLGRVYTETKNYGEAEKIFNRILKLEPSNTEARFGLANVYRLKKDYRAALEEYQYVLKVYPNRAIVYVFIGDVYVDMGKIIKAGSFYRNAVALDSHNPFFHVKLAEYYFKMGKLYSINDKTGSSDYIKAAINESETALEIDKNYADALRILGDIYFFKKDFAEALKYYTTLLNIERTDNILMYTIGLCYEMSGNMKSALKYYLNSLSLRRDDEITRYRLEEVALKLYKVDLKNKTRIELSDYHYSKARFFFNKNFLNKAFFQSKRSVQLDPLNPQKRLFFATIFKLQKYYERYLYELKNIIRDTLDVNTQDINDQIEILENLVSKGLAARWNVKQYLEDKSSRYYVPKSRAKIAVLNAFIPVNGKYIHKSISKSFQEMMCDFLISSPKIEVINPPEEARTDDMALKVAQNSGADFYLTGEVEEENDSISIKVNLNSALNGETVKSYKTYITGNDRIFNSLFTISEDIEKSLPLFGMIVKIEGDRVLLNIGKRHGVKKDMEFVIIKNGEYNPAKNWDLDTIDKSSIIGKVKVTGVDELVSEGKYSYSGIFNRVNEYDTVVAVKAVKKE